MCPSEGKCWVLISCLESLGLQLEVTISDSALVRDKSWKRNSFKSARTNHQADVYCKTKKIIYSLQCHEWAPVASLNSSLFLIRRMAVLCQVYGSLPNMDAKTTALCKFTLISLPRNNNYIKNKNNENDGVSFCPVFMFGMLPSLLCIDCWCLLFIVFCVLAGQTFYNEGKEKGQGINTEPSLCFRVKC